MLDMSVTEDVSNEDKSPSQLVADLNMRAMEVTLDVSHLSRDGLPRMLVQPLNMSAMSVTEEVFQKLKSSSNVVRPLKRLLKEVTWLVSQSEISPMSAVTSALLWSVPNHNSNACRNPVLVKGIVSLFLPCPWARGGVTRPTNRTRSVWIMAGQRC